MLQCKSPNLAKRRRFEGPFSTSALPLEADIQTLSLDLGVPRESVAAYADALKKIELFASDGFALVDDASNLLLAVMTGVSPEDVADEVEA